MDRHRNAIHTDLDLLNRLKPLSFLSADALGELASSLHPANFRKHDVIFTEAELNADLHILLTGVAKITGLNRCGQRVTVAFLAPGPFPEFLSTPDSRWHFRCEARVDCRVGSLGRDQFDVITKAVPQSALRTFHENNLMQWYRWSLGFLGLDFRERLLFTLVQLSSSFGVVESRGTLLLFPFSHKDLAELMGASRPRVTEHLAELVRERLIIRQNHQLVVCVDKIANSTPVPMFRTNDSSPKPSVQPLYGPRSLAGTASRKPLIRQPSPSSGYRPVSSSYRYA
jgi:CRP-like cAMP-binding protein